jgi:hypothetical protein
MRPTSFYTIALLSACCACLQTSAQQEDSIPCQKNYHYHIITVLAGAGILHSGPNNGLLNISFPYSIDRATDTIFHSGDIRPYTKSKIFVLPVEFEVGDLHSFFNAGFSFSIIDGKWTNGYKFSLGYGYNFYLDGFHHSQTIEGKSFVIKPSISIAYTVDNGSNSGASLGSIDNQDKTITVFGKTANPTFDVTTTTDDGNGNTTSSTDTYDARNLNVAYVERELSLVPKIAISNNQYKKGVHWQLEFGYNIPVHELGGFSLTQDDGNGNTNNIAGLIDIYQHGVQATYNGRPVSASPFHFSGPYLEFTLSIPIYKHRA